MMTPFRSIRGYARSRLCFGYSLIILLVVGSLIVPVHRVHSDDFAPQLLQLIDLSVAASKQVVGANDDDHLSGNDVSPFPRAKALAVGDINNDSFPDLIIGAPDADFTPQGGSARLSAGAVYVVFGKASLPTTIDTNAGAPAGTQPEVKVFGAAGGDDLGFAVASRDVNGDGIDDIVMGAPGFDFGDPARDDSGAVFVIYGSTGFTAKTVDLAVANSANVEIGGAVVGDLLGSSIAIGEVNGGVSTPDLFVGAPGSQGPDPAGSARPDGGAAFLFFGGAGLANPGPATKVLDLADADTAQVTIFGNAGSRLGSSLAIGDVNGAGAADLLAGAPHADRPAPVSDVADTGAVFGVLGGTNLNPPVGELSKTFDVSAIQQNLSIYGEFSGDHLGASVATGNVAGDAASDILIGAPDSAGSSGARAESGSAYLLTGGAALTPAVGTTEVRVDVSLATVQLSVFGTAAGDHLGACVSIGVVNTLANTDSTPDLLIGAPDAISGRGTVHLLFGGNNLLLFPARDMLLGQDDIRIIGESAGDQLGRAIAAGDFDKNTGGDMALGAPFADVTIGVNPTRADAGKVYLLLATGSSVPNANPVVVVTDPNGAETVSGGGSFQIKWTATDPNGDATIQSFQLSLSTDGGSTFNTVIAPAVAGTARFFDWDVPTGLNTSTARVRVTAFDNAGGSGQDASDANFTISDGGVAVALMAPNGDESLKWDQTFKISWVVGTGLEDQVKGFDLFYTTDNGSTFASITPVNPLEPALPFDARDFDWTVPRICSSTVKVVLRTTSITSAVSSDSSNSTFSISQPEPHIDTSKISFASSKKLVFKILSGSSPVFVTGVRVEVSTDATGAVFLQVSSTKVNSSGSKFKTTGTINGQKIRNFIPDGAVRFIRVTNGTCGINLLRLQRLGDSMVPAPAAASARWQ